MSDSATLDLVLVMLGHLVKHFQQVADSSVGQLMVTALKNRWATHDQELYMLAYVLNPSRRDMLFNANCIMVSWLNLLPMSKLFGEEAAPADGEALTSEFMSTRTAITPSQWVRSLPSADYHGYCMPCSLQ